MKQIISAFFIAAIFLQGCVTYKDYPKGADASLVQIDDTEVITRIEGYTAGGGFNALADQFRHHAPFKDVQFSAEQIDKGTFIDVNVQAVLPSTPAMVFGYLSVSTLTILPFWSTQDGSLIVFTVYEDGERIRSFEYVVRRSGFVWILMLPLAWVNFLTPSEADAFEAVAQQFFIDYQAAGI